MKKILIFLLLIAMLCTTACGVTDSNEDTAPENNAEVLTEAPTEDPTEPPTEDPHAGWTWLLADVYIPDLPFEDWSGQNQDNISCFTIFIRSKDSRAFRAYVQSLKEFGYTIVQKTGVSYEGTDPEGRKMFFTDHENGQMKITIYY